MNSYGNSKVDRILELCRDFSERDFADLAVAACDQAGMNVRAQQDVREELDRTLEVYVLRSQRAKEGK